MLNKTMKNNYPMYMVIPIIVLFVVFYVGSIAASFGYSLTDWSLTHTKTSWVGLQNFQFLFTDEHFQSAFRNTWIYCIITTFFKLGLGLLLALVMNKSFKGRNFFRAAFYLPCIISPLIIGYIFNFIYRPDVGILDIILRHAGLGWFIKDWLGDMKVALFSVSGVEIWTWTGWSAMIFIAGLQTIPMELTEAARIDGANRIHIFKYIEMPFLLPAFNIVLTLNIIGGFKVFDLIMATTNGGPGYATEVFSSLVYKANSNGTLGYASAIGLVQFLIITIIVLPLLQYLRKKEIEL